MSFLAECMASSSPQDPMDILKLQQLRSFILYVEGGYIYGM